MGTQATPVALPYQLYVQTRSALLVRVGTAIALARAADSGRMSAVYSLVVTGGPRLGAGLVWETSNPGIVASAAGARFSVFSGGLVCPLGLGVIVAAFPARASYDSEQWLAEPAAGAVSRAGAGQLVRYVLR